MKITAFIPIKLNNTRLPGKNIKEVNGIPLIFYIQKTLLKIKDQFDSIFIYCSDENIKQYMLNGIQYLNRPKYLDLDTTLGNEIYLEFLKQIKSDYYLLCHATTPLIKSDTILDMIDKVKNGRYDSSFPACKLKTFLWKDNKPLNFKIENVPKTQDLPDIYTDKSGPYLFSRDTFIKYNRRVGFKPYIKEISFKESIDIDTQEDFDILKKLIS